MHIGRKKVIFVPFQRPDDTAVKFFVRNNTYDDFLKIIQELSDKLPKDYVILAKKHPLEDENFNINGIIYVNEFHINSIINISDYILTFTSGVGLLGIAAGKTVLTVGNSFYSHNGISFNVDSYDDIIDIIHNNKNNNREKMLAFMYYLVFKYYSFGNFKTRDVVMDDGKRITATINIDNEIIRFGNKNVSFLKKSPSVSWNSILFDRYQFSKINNNIINNINKTNSNKNNEEKINNNNKKDEYKKIDNNKDKNINNNNINYSFNERIKRKTLKLISNPKKFFQDMKIFRNIK